MIQFIKQSVEPLDFPAAMILKIND